MNKKQLVEAIAVSADISKKSAENALNVLIHCVITELKEGENVTFKEFGTFGVQLRNARTARNPQTGQEIAIRARRVVTFKPSKVLKAQLN